MFEGGELRLVLLALIEDAPRHGYDLIREIEQRTGGAYAPSPGVVYPTLSLLDEMGLIAAIEEEGARKRFALTEAGRVHLGERRAEADALLARLAEVGARHARHDAGPVRRAMGNLRTTLVAALDAGDGERAHAIAEILDEAARKVERLA